MPVERRGWVTHGVCWVNGRPEELSCLAGRRQPSLSGTSRMRRESHVRICERLGVRFPGPTRRWLKYGVCKDAPDTDFPDINPGTIGLNPRTTPVPCVVSLKGTDGIVHRIKLLQMNH